ncbi:extracellular solute-binding protein [Paeniglutamicibacter gangotriensis]|uniref:Extracellular solute-binding protein n=1 Tax=Paeniglutamicibacter gangotriensis TaxID=254787 RepID=A0A5B0EHT9_9MICC|nr:ABC transporter substrate-binding protein [Paeniglutamicibacter gangotriensis]KAA0977330.1 extracellular solute-binding protein [Paeniglutamicibacter gangotriensis]
MKRRSLLAVSVVLALSTTLAACGSGGGSTASVDGIDAATAVSAADFGGIEKLVEAAELEGELNVIALPEDWANYGAVITGFEEKYDIEVNSANPNASSAEEIQAAVNQKGQDTAPDVFDLGAAVALTNTDKFAPYKVETWDSIPEANKHPEGLWVNNYTGIMSVGYDSSNVPEPKDLEGLLGEDYKGAVALNGDPTQAGAAFAAMGTISELAGGSVADFGPGIDWMLKLKDTGNFLTVDPTPATIASGETPVVFDWSFNNAAATAGNPDFKTTILPGAAYVSFYNEAINADAPHPAAARLWQEWIFSDEVQLLFMEGNSVPVRVDALKESGTVDEALLQSTTFGTTSADWDSPSEAETKAANTLLGERWSELTQ